MDISLTKLPWYWQIFAFILLAGGGAGAYYYYIELPARADISARQFQLTALHNDVAKGNATAKKLPEFRAQVADLEGRLENLKAVLPDQKDVADLLRRLQVEAARSNLEIKAFKPSATVTKQLHAEWPITLELEGTYHNLALFFDRVGKFTRIVNITGLDVKGKDKDKGDPRTTITATCVATTFVLLDKPAPPKPAPKA
jgi:type IV pilus assembly protein PilO